MRNPIHTVCSNSQRWRKLIKNNMNKYRYNKQSATQTIHTFSHSKTVAFDRPKRRTYGQNAHEKGSLAHKLKCSYTEKQRAITRSHSIRPE